MIQPIDVSIIIVNWNTRSMLKACLGSLFSLDHQVSLQVMVVDNGSKDGSVAMVKKSYPQVELIENDSNLGFSKPNNQGIARAQGRYVFLLNSDTLVPNDSLKNLVGYLDAHPQVAAVGPKMLNPDGTIQREGFYRKFPNLLQVVLFYTPLRRIAFMSQSLTKKLWEDFDESTDMEIDQIPGAALMVRSEVLKKVGLLEERFPIWFEDVDWCFRARKMGYTLMYISSASIIHYGGASFSKWAEKGRMLQLFSSMYLFFTIHKGRWQAELMRLIILSASVVSVGFNYIRKVLHLPGFKADDYQARKWFVGRFMRRITVALPLS